MCIVCLYSFEKGNEGPRFYESWGHNFGHKSSVCNYNRTPLFCCQAARCLFAIPVEHYVDDYCTPDFVFTVPLTAARPKPCNDYTVCSDFPWNR